MDGFVIRKEYVDDFYSNIPNENLNVQEKFHLTKTIFEKRIERLKL